MWIRLATCGCICVIKRRPIVSTLGGSLMNLRRVYQSLWVLALIVQAACSTTHKNCEKTSVPVENHQFDKAIYQSDLETAELDPPYESLCVRLCWFYQPAGFLVEACGYVPSSDAGIGGAGGVAQDERVGQVHCLGRIEPLCS